MQRAYAVETYLPLKGSVSFGEATTRARSAADELRQCGRAIRYLRSLYLPSDETCFHVFVAGDVATVVAASTRAHLLHQRIVEAVE